MIERREYIDRIRAELALWSEALLGLEHQVIAGDPTAGELWEDQRQELQRLMLAVQDNIRCLRQHQAANGHYPAWRQLRCDLHGLTERLYPGN